MSDRGRRHPHGDAQILGPDGKSAQFGVDWVKIDKQSRFNPLRNWTPDVLTRQLESFASGNIRELAWALFQTLYTNWHEQPAIALGNFRTSTSEPGSPVLNFFDKPIEDGDFRDELRSRFPKAAP